MVGEQQALGSVVVQEEHDAGKLLLGLLLVVVQEPLIAFEGTDLFVQMFGDRQRARDEVVARVEQLETTRIRRVSGPDCLVLTFEVGKRRLGFRDGSAAAHHRAECLFDVQHVLLTHDAEVFAPPDTLAHQQIEHVEYGLRPGHGCQSLPQGNGGDVGRQVTDERLDFVVDVSLFEDSPEAVIDEGEDDVIGAPEADARMMFADRPCMVSMCSSTDSDGSVSSIDSSSSPSATAGPGAGGE